ncbi:hypothetical protein EH31_09520 [Erythrobacter longus]|uniref:Uncharacterized protein n=1 Tax=Erythrobacter longus TaxID=1044 RepID=A0A074MEM4_ERYLO|nr:hypothetical protein [Erythrobacter longus]KEO90318.1 hypothetical protein EH31_09520 [Erythrobacter longus]
MSNAPAPTPEEAIAAKRYMVMNLVRLGAIVAVGLGIAIARDVIALPYALGVGLALAGLVTFFFLPVTLAKRWKAGDREMSNRDISNRGEK